MKPAAKLPSPSEVQEKTVRKIDEEREALRRRMMMWDGGKHSRITLYDLTNKQELLLELEGLGWKRYQDIAVEPHDWVISCGAALPTPKELYEALEKEHGAVIQRELIRLRDDVLPRIQRSAQQRGIYTCAGLHPFVVNYLMESLRESGWWVDFAPYTMGVEKQLIISPKTKT